MLRDNTFPRRFGSFELIRELGRGSTGVVYLAHHLKFDRSAAIKCPFNYRTNRHLREARSQASIDHPNVVTLWEVAGIGGEFYLCREYVDGADLQALLRSRTINLSSVTKVIGVIASAVQSVHRNGLIHRGIDLSNILISKDGNPKLIGFGRAKTADDDPASGNAQRATDIQLLGRLLTQSSESLDEPLSEVLEAIALKCEKANTDWGYQSASQLAEDLKRYGYA